MFRRMFQLLSVVFERFLCRGVFFYLGVRPGVLRWPSQMACPLAGVVSVPIAGVWTVVPLIVQWVLNASGQLPVVLESRVSSAGHQQLPIPGDGFERSPICQAAIGARLTI